MNKSKGTIQEILEEKLCTGCGTCAGTCPNSAIEMVIDKKTGVYKPDINDRICKECNLCYEICPKSHTGHPIPALKKYKEDATSLLLGDVKNCYLAHSTDSKIRFNSSSGGLVTSILIFALENGIIDGAIVTKMSKENPLIPEPFIARTKDEIIEASKSKYCPVPTNKIIKEIINQNGKFAVVGLPCHINGIRAAEKKNTKLAKKIVLHLGLFCSHTDTFRGTEYLLKNLHIEESNVESISYRGEGWPGEVNIKVKKGLEKKILLATPLWITFHDSLFFAPTNCLFCSDVTAELSDISFGDAWLPEIQAKEKKGKSIIIVRNESGNNLVTNAYSQKAIDISLLDSKNVIKSQKLFLHFKKININSRIFIYRLTDKKLRGYKDCKLNYKSSIDNKIIALIILTNNYIVSKIPITFLINAIPTKLLKLYVDFYYTLYIIIIKKDFDKYGL